ncbi:MAG: glycine cleavage system aminomethyltransferase GcvT [Pseudomonadales bacterium]|nr:glycine cleavage system aminomethyltransferase GcvT [Pseudomonadales bacterium]
MGLRTPIYQQHLNAGAKMVDFGGWDMPIHYGSQIQEHHIVRSSVGVCDVSHMTVVDITGAASQRYLSFLLANDVAKLKQTGAALYSAMLNEAGGVLDDLIVYKTDSGYRLVVNCATREKDLAWMTEQIKNYQCELSERPELAILAIQGPAALETVRALLSPAQSQFVAGLGPFKGGFCENWFLARTGYTGEKGIEIILSSEAAQRFWQMLLEKGVKPIGLGARDTLRLEAGMNLYGSDMDETVTPFASNMAITVVMDGERQFIGKAALQAEHQTGLKTELTGLVLRQRGVLRAHYPIYLGAEKVGEITSGAHSPTLGYSVALARIKTGLNGDLEVLVRNKRLPVLKVKPPFVRNGKQVYKLP